MKGGARGGFVSLCPPSEIGSPPLTGLNALYRTRFVFPLGLIDGPDRRMSAVVLPAHKSVRGEGGQR